MLITRVPLHLMTIVASDNGLLGLERAASERLEGVSSVGGKGGCSAALGVQPISADQTARAEPKAEAMVDLID